MHSVLQESESQVQLVDQVSPEREVRRVRREIQEFLCQDHLEGQEHQDYKVHLDHQAPQEPQPLPRAA